MSIVAPGSSSARRKNGPVVRFHDTCRPARRRRARRGTSPSPYQPTSVSSGISSCPSGSRPTARIGDVDAERVDGDADRVPADRTGADREDRRPARRRSALSGDSGGRRGRRDGRSRWGAAGAARRGGTERGARGVAGAPAGGAAGGIVTATAARVAAGADSVRLPASRRRRRGGDTDARRRRGRPTPIRAGTACRGVDVAGRVSRAAAAGDEQPGAARASDAGGDGEQDDVRPSAVDGQAVAGVDERRRAAEAADRLGVERERAALEAADGVDDQVGAGLQLDGRDVGDRDRRRPARPWRRRSHRRAGRRRPRSGWSGW